MIRLSYSAKSIIDVYDRCIVGYHIGLHALALDALRTLRQAMIGRLEIDNNRTEHSIKSFVIARKNFLFCVAPYGAKASAIRFSLIESAKENGLKPFEYLKHLLEELPNTRSQDLDKFMPWSEHIPEHCRTPKRR